MKIIFSLFVISLILFPVSSTFEFFTLALQWPESVCSKFFRSKKKCPNDFTIHGLWPQSSNGILEKCPPNSLFEPIMNGNLKQRLETSWPDLVNVNDANFWKQEWDKHGTCSENKYKQTAYFNLALKLKAMYDIKGYLKHKQITPTKTKEYPVIDIITNISAYTGQQPELRCINFKRRKVQQLKEVYLCFDPNGSERPCPPTGNCNTYTTVSYPA